MNLRFLKPGIWFLLAMFFISCSEEANPETEEPEIPEVEEDQYNYIALRNDGTLFSIGDNSGLVTSIGEIPGLEFNTIFNTVTSSPEHTYIYEAWFDPIEGRLFKLNKETKQSEKIILNFPEEFGSNPGIMALDWDQTNHNLIGIVRQEFDIPSFNGPVKIVLIDSETFEFTVLDDINLNAQGYRDVFSSQLIGQKLYVSASKDDKLINADLLEINLTDKTINVLPREKIQTGLLNLGWIAGSQKLFGFAPILNSEYMGAVRPYIYNTNNTEMEEINAVQNISAIHFSHKSFYHSETNSFIGLIGKDGFNLFNFNTKTNNFSLTPIDNPEDLSSLVTIIGVKKL